ncbi:hypothetical protein Y032_0231g3003 [Ancylostoma ceylanicum]|uniref:Uncharacterized protein n=2 Tax=Ancylostoma ceylanicum TaxID=53326 RepID=A0A016SFW0_9BILA|nr:hypothetical protein Y032_0231g3003 [Ancylostoma ceylanicum]
MQSRNKLVQDCSSDEIQSVTKVDNGSVTLIKGYETFKCKARLASMTGSLVLWPGCIDLWLFAGRSMCLFYEDDSKYNASEWKTIEETKFSCDFIETDCKFQNVSKKSIHMQIEENKSSKEMPVLKREDYPDVHLIVLDSVASSQLIRCVSFQKYFLEF